MATVLRRPMFRLGGPSSDGVGITSGLRRYGFADPEKNIDERFSEQTEEILNPKKARYGWKELISDAYRTSKGASTGSEWLTNAADLALERGDAAKAEAKAKKLSDWELMKKIRDDKFKRSQDAFNRKTTLRTLGQSDTQLGQADKQIAQAQDDFEWKKKQDQIRNKLDQAIFEAGDQTIKERMKQARDVVVAMSEWQEANPEGSIIDWMTSGNMINIDAKLRSANPSFKGITYMLAEIDDQIKDWNPGAYDGDNMTLGKEPWEIENKRRELVQYYLGQYLSFSGKNLTFVDETWEGARGGRPGYNMGMGPVMDQQTDMSMTENIDTPQGDMSMTENVDLTQMGQQASMPSQTMPSDDPFVLLRARLPEEITDDVVRLIAYNPEAFADFADIETQDDVIAFNKKYGVELVVNTDEVSGAIA